MNGELRGNHARVNGLELYYEVHGEGEPLILLLGGGKRDAGWDGSGMSDSRLAVLPGTTHYDIFFSPALATTVAPFLDAPVSERGDDG